MPRLCARLGMQPTAAMVDTTGRACADSAMLCGRGMAKAARILAALKRDGWIETRRSGSHRSWSEATNSESGPTMTPWT
jgi:hypothetical protein